jgi:hypothetical protein
LITRPRSEPGNSSAVVAFSKVAVPKPVRIFRTQAAGVKMKTPEMNLKQTTSIKNITPQKDENVRVIKLEKGTRKNTSTLGKPNFFLRSSVRHTVFLDNFQKEFEDLQLRVKKETEFHANPLPRTTFTKPRELPKPKREPLKPMEPNFECEERLRKRREFDRQVAVNMEKKKQKDEQRIHQVVEDENMHINLIRRRPISEGGLLFKAKPVETQDKFPTAKPIVRPLTQPKSPLLLTKLRASNDYTGV